uniref:Nodulation protein NfeD n=1 Tax=Ammonifex degensii TaxID=42838 RepID=A0A7C2EIW0_9THEO
MRRPGALFFPVCFGLIFSLFCTVVAGELVCGAWAAPVREEKHPQRVVVLEVKGPVVPVVAHYLSRGIERAEKEGAVCLIRLNTPGGLYNVTQEVVTRIVNAQTPVIVYVSPSGGWAASAGAFITMGAHVAVMAPGTRIGAAHPVGLGKQEEGAPAEKITADAAAWMRSLAELRGRNVKMAEEMVTRSRSFSATEAVGSRLVDLTAASEAELCRKLSGRKVTLATGRAVSLRLAGAAFEELKANRVERFLGALLNPDVAYLLLSIGMAGLMVEIYHPGLIFPGVVGGIALLLGLYSLGTLDAYWGGLLLILLAFGFFVAEAFLPTHGIMGTGGVIAFVFGSLLLFSTAQGGMRVSIGLVAAMSVTLAGLMALLVTAVVRGQRRRVQTGLEELVGRKAVARTDLKPTGMVFVEGEYWRAVMEEGEAAAGERVEVVGIDGLCLKVRRKS